MSEFLSALTLFWCSITYWMGGQGFPKRGLSWLKSESWASDNTEGRKWIRRFLLPIGLCIFLVALGAVWWKAALACSLLCAALHLGYGSEWQMFASTGFLMGLPAEILCWPQLNWMILLPCAFHTGYGLLSLKFNRFQWAWVAQLMGFAIAIAYLSSVKA